MPFCQAPNPVFAKLQQAQQFRVMFQYSLQVHLFSHLSSPYRFSHHPSTLGLLWTKVKINEVYPFNCAPILCI